MYNVLLLCIMNTVYDLHTDMVAVKSLTLFFFNLLA